MVMEYLAVCFHCHLPQTPSTPKKLKKKQGRIQGNQEADHVPFSKSAILPIGGNKMGRRLIVGDIHGHYKLLREVLDKAAFDPKEDTLFSVGDFFDKTDSFGETIATMEYILYLNKLGCLKAVLGNHDAWLEQYLILHWASSNWKDNGGYTTIAAANAIGDYRREDLREFLSELPLIIFDGNDIIMHAGPYKCTTEEELKELSERKRPVPAFRYANQYDFPLEPDHDEEFLKKQKWVVDILFERDYIFSSVPKE